MTLLLPEVRAPNSSGMGIYFVQAENTLIKIGRTIHLRKRLRELRCTSPSSLRLLAFVHAEGRAEQCLHRAFADFWHHGEWHYPGAPLLQLITSLNAPRCEPYRVLMLFLEERRQSVARVPVHGGVSL